MVLTKSQAAAACKHVLENVMGLDAQSPLQLALAANGIDDIRDLIVLSKDEVAALEYDASGTTKKVPVHQCKLVKILRDFIDYRSLTGNPVGTNFLSLNEEEFSEFQISPNYDPNATGNARFASIGTSSTGPSATVLSMNSHSAVEAIRKSIKKDQSAFPTLKDERFHDSWHREFVNQCRAQGVSEVIDKSYTPSTPDQVAVFQVKQEFVYAVLASKVLTTKGKEIVRKHFDKADAQKAYEELEKHHTSSTSAVISARDILSYLTTVKIGDGRFRGTTSDFIAHFMQQVKLYEKLTSTTMSDSDKTMHLS
jgi:hypothetical protein